MKDVTVVIPVEKGRVWQRDRATNIPVGTRILEAQHDPGEWASALNEAVQRASTEFVIVSAPDAWFERKPEAVEFLTDLCWDVDVTWGPLVVFQNGQGVGVTCEGAFCPHRLTRENYISPVFCVRRAKFLEVGGVTSGLWDLHIRILKAGGKFKYVPEARAARDEPWDDPSPKPEPDKISASFYHQATIGTTYWRCLLPSRFLPGQSLFNLPEMGEENNKLTFPKHEGAAVFQYVGDAAHHLVVKTMRGRGIRTLVEVDDDYTRWSKGVMTKAGWYRTPSSAPEGAYTVEGHRETVKQADGVIVTTPRLEKLYRELNPNVYVCPNQIDPADWPELEKPDDGVFRIGWFASASHNPDGELIMRALEWAGRQPGVEVVMIGIGATKTGRPMYTRFPYKHYPWSNDLGVYRKFLLDLDVGLAPVVGNPWALCRSDLKALEYVMAGAMPIVSDREPYAHCEMPGMFRCHDAKSFLLAVQWCVENRDEVKQLAAEARDYVLAERTVEANIGRWREAVAA